MVRLAPPLQAFRLRKLPHLYTWLSSSKLIVTKASSSAAASAGGAGSKATHTVLNSRVAKFGVINIPDDRLDAFIDNYCISLEKRPTQILTGACSSDAMIYISERIDTPRSPRRLFFDFDLHFEGNLSKVDEMDLFRGVIETVFGVVAEYTSPETAFMYVLSAGMSLEQGPAGSNSNADEVVASVMTDMMNGGGDGDGDGNGDDGDGDGGDESCEGQVQKSRLGLHFVWPRLIVDQAKQFAFRRAVVLRLSTTFCEDPARPYTSRARIGDHQLCDAWAAIVDENVIKTQNLRMPYSRKAKQDKDKKCACGLARCGCVDGCADFGRPYVPFATCDVVDGSRRITTLDPLAPAHIRPTVTLATVRVKADTPMTQECSISDGELLELYRSEVDASAKAIGVGGGRARKLLPVSDDARDVLTLYVRAFWAPYIVRDHPISIQRDASGYKIPLHTTRCLNAHGGRHTSAQTYLIVSPFGVFHCCWSKKRTKRRFFACGGPRGIDSALARRCVSHKLNHSMSDLLFPPKKKQL